jgi:hypothetical protein
MGEPMKVSLDSIYTTIRFLEKDSFFQEAIDAVVEDNLMNSFFVAVCLSLPRTQFPVAAIHSFGASKDSLHHSSLLI